MTDKVIIDGVDVSRCEHYLNKECLCQYNEIDGRIFKLYRCDTFENCYYKQLQRKEQECEELKEKLNDVACCDDGNTFCFLKQEIVEQLQRKEQECEELKEQVNRCSEGWGKSETEKEWYKQADQANQEEKYSLTIELDRYKQALEEIETYCTEQLNEHFNHCKYAKGCVNACGISKEVLLKAIIDKIKEVMND